MREFWIIFKHAFLSKAKTKSFVITTAIMIAGIFLFANISKIIDTVQTMTGGGDDEQVLYVVDESGQLADRLTLQLSGMKVEQPSESKEALIEKLTSEEIDSVLTLAVDSQGVIEAEYTTMSLMDFAIPMQI